MKSVIFYLFMVIAVICLFMKHASSIKCYECKTDLLNGSADTGCRDKYGNNKTRECLESVCSVLVKTQENGEGSVTRSCGTKIIRTLGGEVLSGKDQGEYNDNGTRVSFRKCATDMCNWDITQYRTRRDVDKDPFNIGDIMGNTPGKSDFTVTKEGRQGGIIKCYACEQSSLYHPDRNCETNMIIVNCNFGACLKAKFATAGHEAMIRDCYDPRTTPCPFLPDDDFVTITSKHMTISRSISTTHLCNWGVANEYKMTTIIATAMLSMSVYGTFI